MWNHGTCSWSQGTFHRTTVSTVKWFNFALTFSAMKAGFSYSRLNSCVDSRKLNNMTSSTCLQLNKSRTFRSTHTLCKFLRVSKVAMNKQMTIWMIVIISTKLRLQLFQFQPNPQAGILESLIKWLHQNLKQAMRVSSKDNRPKRYRSRKLCR